MKVFMIGGTGLLGSEGAREMIRRGHSVTAIALPPIPQGAVLPPEMEIEMGNYLEMSDEDIRGYMTGCEGFVFAAGVDERVEGAPPVYEMFKKYNITPLARLLRIAKECGVKRAVICGSYFVHFARIWPQYEMAKNHPYIRSRVDQEDMALSYADDSFAVSVLELPYIFGTQPGRKPVWMFLVEQIQGMKDVTMYPPGGTTMVTVKQVGQCLAGALENTKGGCAYPVGYYNLTWKEMLAIIHKYMGVPNKKIKTVPKFLYKLGMKSIAKEKKGSGLEGGLEMVAFADVMCRDTFIDKATVVNKLGVQPDDIDAAIGQSITLCTDIMRGKAQVIDMKGE